MATTITSNLFPLGWIAPTPGTPLDVFQNITALRDEEFFGNLIMFQAGASNTGKVYIGNTDLNVATKAGVNFILMAAGDSFSLGTVALNILEIRKFRIDVESAGDGVYVNVFIR